MNTRGAFAALIVLVLTLCGGCAVKSSTPAPTLPSGGVVTYVPVTSVAPMLAPRAVTGVIDPHPGLRFACVSGVMVSDKVPDVQYNGSIAHFNPPTKDGAGEVLSAAMKRGSGTKQYRAIVVYQGNTAIGIATPPAINPAPDGVVYHILGAAGATGYGLCD